MQLRPGKDYVLLNIEGKETIRLPEFYFSDDCILSVSPTVGSCSVEGGDVVMRWIVMLDYVPEYKVGDKPGTSLLDDAKAAAGAVADKAIGEVSGQAKSWVIDRIAENMGKAVNAIRVHGKRVFAKLKGHIVLKLLQAKEAGYGHLDYYESKVRQADGSVVKVIQIRPGTAAGLRR